jgi:hypothetical protein
MFSLIHFAIGYLFGAGTTHIFLGTYYKNSRGAEYRKKQYAYGAIYLGIGILIINFM